MSILFQSNNYTEISEEFGRLLRKRKIKYKAGDWPNISIKADDYRIVQSDDNYIDTEYFIWNDEIGIDRWFTESEYAEYLTELNTPKLTNLVRPNFAGPKRPWSNPRPIKQGLSKDAKIRAALRTHGSL